LVLTYDLLEDIDEVITNIFPLFFKMAESFEKILDNILPDWAKENFEKSLVKAVNRYEKQEEERKTCFFEENDSEKYSSSLS